MKRILFLFVLLSPIAYAIDVEIEEGITECYPNGQIKTVLDIEVGSSESDYSFSCNKLDAYDNRNENLTADFDCYIRGKKRSSITIASGSTESVTLISAEGKFNESENYRIRTILDSKREYAGTTCPGYYFSCEDVSIRINCVKKENRFEVIVKDVPELPEDADLTEYFEIMPNYKAYYGTPTWTTGGTYRIEKIENKYLIKVYPPVLEESMAVRMTRCPEEAYSTFDYASCKGSFTCETDADCLEGYACESGSCQQIVCTPCEYLDGNECRPKRCNDNNPCTEDSCDASTGECRYTLISEDCCATDLSCDDGLACTEDMCIDQKCVFEQKTCPEPENPCMKAVCIEPDGCVEKVSGLFCRIKYFFKNLFTNPDN